jgi:hypothetical protein
VAVCELGVGDCELPLQARGLAADLVEPAVGLRVDARDEEAGHGGDELRVTAGRDEALETPDVGLGDRCVAVEREDQGDVDRLALRDAVLDRGKPGQRRRNLDEEIRPVDLRVEADRLLEGLFAVVGEGRVDLERDPAVEALALVPDGAQQVARILDVLLREVEEDLGRVVLGLHHLGEPLVVPVARGERFLEDRRIGGHADDRVLLHQPGQLARLEHLARKRVDPDADSLLRELVQS